MAAYKKSPKGLKSPLSSSTRAGFCLSQRSGKPGRRAARRLSFEWLADGRRYPLSRPSVSRPRESELVFTSVFMSPRISGIPRSMPFCGTSLNISRGALFLSGIGAPLIKPERFRGSSKPTGVFMPTTSPDMPLSLTPTSMRGIT